MSHSKTKLEIVWRNPQRACTSRRRHTFVSKGEQGLYILEESVSDGYLGSWSTLSNLEVVAGGKSSLTYPQDQGQVGLSLLR
jgi:hypothetical protein